MYDGKSKFRISRSSETVLSLATPENGETIVNDLIAEKLSLIIMSWMISFIVEVTVVQLIIFAM